MMLPRPTAESSVPESTDVSQFDHRERSGEERVSPRVSVRRWWSALSLMLAVTIGAGFLCLMFGARPLSLAEIWSALVPASGAERSVAQVIVWEIRFPRILMGLFVGASLAMVGAALQALVRNPLADPYVLGVSSGAALGATVGLALGLGSFAGGVGVPLAAFLGSAVTILIVYGIAASQGRLPIQTLLLAGVIVNAICSALMMFTNSILAPTSLYRVVVWLMGSLGAPSYAGLAGMGCCTGAAMALLLRRSQELNLIAVGEDTALSLGVEVVQVQRMIFFVSALVTGAVVAVSGMIGFVGMVVPHLVRMLWGADHRLLFPLSALGGGILLMVADTIARTVVAPEEIPVGVITALIGGPFFIYLLMTRQYRFVV
jgi:ABC-type Fe3+-siderophore transport system permease subunit